jgi:hypothetical protein
VVLVVEGSVPSVEEVDVDASGPFESSVEVGSGTTVTEVELRVWILVVVLGV